MKRTAVALLLAASLATPVIGMADEVKDAIKDALQAYEKGDVAQAKENLGFATQLLNEMGADSLAKVLPKPLPGWEATEAESSGAGAALFGGGVQATRTYNKDEKYVQVEILGDSPMMSQMMMIMGNPALAGSMGKMVRVGKQRGILDSEGKIMIMINNRFMVSIDGEADAADKMAYAEAVDYTALQAL